MPDPARVVSRAKRKARGGLLARMMVIEWLIRTNPGGQGAAIAMQEFYLKKSRTYELARGGELRRRCHYAFRSTALLRQHWPDIRWLPDAHWCAAGNRVAREEVSSGDAIEALIAAGQDHAPAEAVALFLDELSGRANNDDGFDLTAWLRSLVALCDRLQAQSDYDIDDAIFEWADSIALEAETQLTLLS